MKLTLFSRHGRSKGLLYKHLRHWLNPWSSRSSFVKISLRRWHALISCRWAFSHKINYDTILLEIQNLEGHPNRITGSKVMAILLNGWILPIGGVASERVCACSLRSRLVLRILQQWQMSFEEKKGIFKHFLLGTFLVLSYYFSNKFPVLSRPS